jgi:hypothetical protein
VLVKGKRKRRNRVVYRSINHKVHKENRGTEPLSLLVNFVVKAFLLSITWSFSPYWSKEEI